MLSSRVGKVKRMEARIPELNLAASMRAGQVGCSAKCYPYVVLSIQVVPKRLEIDRYLVHNINHWVKYCCLFIGTN